MKKTLQTLLLLAILPWFSVPAAALSLFGGNSADELLDPESAFSTEATIDSKGQLQIEIGIAEGYYLYKDKIKIDSDHASFANLTLPAGIVKKDEFFGEVETYRGLLTFNSSFKSQTSGPLTVVLTSQGCADIGVCYPPQKKSFTLDVPAPPKSSVISSALKTAGGLANPLLTESNPGYGNSEVMDPEDAFVMQQEPAANNVAVITWSIAPGYYMYHDKFSFVVTSPEQASTGDIELTRGKLQHDEFFGNVEVNRNFATAKVALKNLTSAGLATIKVGYQGCADIGVCYPPQFKIIEASLQAPTAATVGLIAANSNPANASPDTTGTGSTAVTGSTSLTNMAKPVNTMVSAQDQLANSLKSDSRLTTIATFFGMGLLLAFTPCVLPMVPILSSLIVGQGEGTTTAKSFTLSLIYVLAMALTYTIAGVAVGLSGENIQATLQHPYVLVTFALLFTALAASMFGLFKLQMPSFVQNKLTNISNQQKKGSYGGVAIMGVLSALIVGPCVTAPLVGALIYIGQTGDAVLGGAALFALSMGMGLPLLIIGTSFGKYLPTAGAWMNTINAVFGVLLLGVAIWLLERVIPAWSTMLLAALLLISVGIFLGAFDAATQSSNWRKLSRGFGYAAIVYGTLLIIGIATGKGTIIRPLQGLAMSNQSANVAGAHVTFSRIKGLEQLDAALASARATGKPVILDFYADWCISCKEMEAFTFTDPTVATKMNQAILLQADVTDNDDDDKAMLRKFSLYGPPAIIFYTADGEELSNARVVGFMNAEKFGQHLDILL